MYLVLGSLLLDSQNIASNIAGTKQAGNVVVDLHHST